MNSFVRQLETIRLVRHVIRGFPLRKPDQVVMKGESDSPCTAFMYKARVQRINLCGI
jgi:hypothetical protein